MVIFRRTFWTVVALVVAILVATGINYLTKRGTVSRDELDIASSSMVCVDPFRPFASTFVSEVVANQYLPYGIASFNAYEDPNVTDFVLSRYDARYEKFAVGDEGSVHFNAYILDGINPVVIVAFRGTRGPNLEDWLTNLSWFTTVLPIRDSYAVARREFQRVRKLAEERAAGRPITYIAAGHSLGGGFAQHLAFGFPCTFAAVFDTSPVVNRHVYSQPYDAVVVHLYDKEDELTFLRELFFPQSDTDTYRWYPIRLVPSGTLQHDIARFVVGMSGTVVDCQLARSKDCRIPASDTRAVNLYCTTHGRKDAICQPVLRRLSDGS